MSDKIKSNHADLLNNLDSMQRSPLYALRHGVLRQAELLIVSQEQLIADQNKLAKERQDWALQTNETIRELKSAVRDLLDNIDVPEPNCNCHLSPPCGDCVENSCLREAVARAKELI